MTSKTQFTEALTPDDVSKLKAIMEAGLRAKQEIKDLGDGLKDTVKAFAEEINVKPAVIMKAINVAFKESLEADREAFDTVEDILDMTGHS